jgi:ADP-ribose pyrophosphatase
MNENRIVSTKRAMSGRFINIDIDRVRLANGVEVDLEIIRHPGAAAVVPVFRNQDGEIQVLLIRQFRHAAGGTIWEIPAGVLEKDEKPEDCAIRELKEETGAVAGKIEHLATILTTPGFTDERIHLFLATDVELGSANPEDDEEIETVITPMAEVLEMIKTGTINDSKTISGILLAKDRLRF